MRAVFTARASSICSAMPSKHCPATCQEFDKIHAGVVAEGDDTKRAENNNRMIELVANTWIAVPILEGMGYWAVNTKQVGNFKAIPWSP